MKKSSVSIKPLADGMLLLSGLGVLVSYPFQGGFWGGLAFAGSSAATIGGLADLFAVTALFRDPLGIRWPRWFGTRVISRNRERLMRELVSMVENDLLTVGNIQSKIDGYSFPDLLFTYLNEHGGRADMAEILHRLARDMLEQADAGDVAAALQRFLFERAGRVQASPLLADIADWSIRQGYDELAVQFFLRELERLVRQDGFLGVIRQLADTTLQAYESNNLRKTVNAFIGINADTVSVQVQSWLAAYLRDMAAPDHPYRLQMKEWFRTLAGRLRTDEVLQARVEAGKQKLLAALREQVSLEDYVARWLQAYVQQSAADDAGAEASAPFRRLVDRAADYAQSQPLQLAAWDKRLKEAARVLVERYHPAIGRMVHHSLSAYTDKALIELVQSRAGRDLQFIRLSGWTIGGLAGMLLFILTFWLR